MLKFYRTLYVSLLFTLAVASVADYLKKVEKEVVEVPVVVEKRVTVRPIKAPEPDDVIVVTRPLDLKDAVKDAILVFSIKNGWEVSRDDIGWLPDGRCSMETADGRQYAGYVTLFLGEVSVSCVEPYENGEAPKHVLERLDSPFRFESEAARTQIRVVLLGERTP